MPERNNQPGSNVDVLIIGAGAAGMMCAIEAARRGRSVMLLDHATKLAEKIRISGGGRCNFTNQNAQPGNFISTNPHFCRSALARYTPQHFITWLNKAGLSYHEKKLGQLFCDEGSGAIIAMLKNDCDAVGVQWVMPCEVFKVERHPHPSPPPERAGTGLLPPSVGESVARRLWEEGGLNPANPDVHTERFITTTSRGTFHTQSLVIASGGLSIPKIGATPFGYRIAQQFGLPVTKLKPGLVPLSFHPDEWTAYAGLSGISVDAAVSFGGHSFRENMLCTHRGLSGPAILQISSYWEHGQPLHINLLPDHDMLQVLMQQRDSRMLLSNFLAQYLPKRFAEIWCAQLADNKPLNQYTEKEIAALAVRLHDWQITPSGTLGYAKAEVTCGGVDTHALSSKTMQANDAPGLYFIGEVVDVTGQLGGYNFQWAWASGYAAGQYC